MPGNHTLCCGFRQGRTPKGTECASDLFHREAFIYSRKRGEIILLKIIDGLVESNFDNSFVHMRFHSS